jgi:hypothetical protein
MHIEISLLKEVERVKRTKISIELGERTTVLTRLEEMPMRSSSVERTRCGWGFLSLRRCKSVF